LHRFTLDSFSPRAQVAVTGEFFVPGRTGPRGAVSVPKHNSAIVRRQRRRAWGLGAPAAWKTTMRRIF
jgi:hypothetical protein